MNYFYNIALPLIFMLSMALPQKNPERLSPGDTILFVAPSGYLKKERMALAKKRLEERGYITIQSDDIFRQHGYLGGTDKRRVDEFMVGWTNPHVKAIFPGTGGYGTTRILDQLDYNIIKANPKILVGFSDITGLHLAINKMTGLTTFHTPSPMYGLGSAKNLSPISNHYFWQAIEKDNPNGYTIDPKDFELEDSIITLHGGKGKGELIGGNLSLINTLMGTPYEIETKGRILFIEDVGEAPYRIDRYFSQLKMAGKFDHLEGVIIGKLTRRPTEPPDDENSFTMMEVLEQYFSKLGVPVLANFPIGHYKHNISLPIGIMAEIDADKQLIHILENPTQ
ncbi:MAG: LD-carboxypeptidase [Candidatus Marinimicrobia bacterium]|jgi:muramoyltetrapeptide carboxypeptidase|nr:LD-carboxypeptidase [Candidatus Neomarinimicrobiota bacterium]MBT5759231.1 LD-carboxypeptidase [Candidatus Neomarinimicrobiota bacterium]MBT6517949.1 LD-carboxypeptidase [Candidatus Neomarinimicrobiota bacterium]MBT6711881.1 LD-carboxypeptidase [Candidatus Neomarinimicrobiota bacterium]MBT7520078.1 LD-carboxypeptidase [Candidatus Neomarinimicrobiota bacterium]